MRSLLATSCWRRGLSVAACLASFLDVGCTDPVYRDDAGNEAGEPTGDGQSSPPSCEEPSCQTPPTMDAGGDSGEDTARDASGDAEPAVQEAGLDAIRSKWVGLYATRSFLFAYDNPLETQAHFLTLAEIKPTADGGLVLEEELCEYDGEWAFVVRSKLRVAFPATRVSSPLTFDADSFESAQAKAMIGYTPEASGCGSEGGTAPAAAHQVWLTGGTCDCVTGQPVPVTSRDCRLSDEDRDQKPGHTFEATIATSTYQYHVVQEERLRLLNGYKLDERDGRLYAEREFAETTKVLGCVVDGVPKRIADCPVGAGWNCPADTQPAELARLMTPLTCRQVIEREAGLFTTPPMSFPADCRR